MWAARRRAESRECVPRLSRQGIGGKLAATAPMRRQAKKEKRLADEQDTVGAQRAERRELESVTPRKKLETTALRALERNERAALSREATPRRLRPGKPPQR